MTNDLETKRDWKPQLRRCSRQMTRVGSQLSDALGGVSQVGHKKGKEVLYCFSFDKGLNLLGDTLFLQEEFRLGKVEYIWGWKTMNASFGSYGNTNTDKGKVDF